jgi:hypothetical protein
MLVMWVGMVVVKGDEIVLVVLVVVGEDVVVVLNFGMLVVAGVGMGLKLIINLSRSMKSFGLSGAKETGLFSWLKVRLSEQNGVTL